MSYSNDPLSAFAIHGCSGFWGVLAPAFFAANPSAALLGASALSQTRSRSPTPRVGCIICCDLALAASSSISSLQRRVSVDRLFMHSAATRAVALSLLTIALALERRDLPKGASIASDIVGMYCRWLVVMASFQHV